jgi:hypothetical protein
MSSDTRALRLSARARAVLDLAHELGRREPGIEPHSGHVLIALLRASDGVIEDTMHQLSITYDDVVAATASIGDVPDAKRELHDLLAAADGIAQSRGQSVIDAPALLGAVMQVFESVGARALSSLGIARMPLERLLRAHRDMLVPLLALPDPAPVLARAADAGFRIRRARAWEAPLLQDFITAQTFARTWAPEAANGFANRPISVFLAERAVEPEAEGAPGNQIAGFAAYDCGLRGIFGPMGVAVGERASGVARALLRRTLADMRAVGYAYAIIGAVGPAEFYERACDAVLLPSAWPSYVESAE